ncbi:LOW QUALITY PROTEIN: hypothetical protein PHMEG_00011625 [Phytophthora megakarya]|uniref:Uncharacterized protein n=1 Tax=Phytophthora megakarya TaxID=4795 RepID=A0A225WB84_9STRA|nr:LOW QUALITY PROTEIN: hypothetical protein PHMEG_00011625 [Phytophthora megakarya]
MAPSAPLQAVKFVLLLPERLPEATLDGPLYAQVTRRMKTGALLREIGSANPRKWKISSEQAIAWAVPSTVIATYPTPLLRSPVAVIVSGHILHGQIVDLDDQGVRVSTAEGEYCVALTCVTTTPPVAAVLLRSLTFDAEDWSITDIVGMHHHILNRIMGNDGIAATNNIKVILHDLIDSDLFFDATDVISWINPATGLNVQFPVQHAVDYAYYKDGGVQPTPDSLGTSFCIPPRTTSNTHVATRRIRRIAMMSPSNQAPERPITPLAMFDAQNDDDELLVEDDNLHESTNNSSTREQRRESTLIPPSAKRVRTSAPLGHHYRSGEILAALAAHPHVQRAFAEDYLPSHAVDATTTAIEDHRRQKSLRSRNDRPINSDTISERSSLGSYLGFTSSRYGNGKLRGWNDFVKPLPGVVTRTRDIQFGKRGLSVMHFYPLPFEDKVVWYNNGGCTYQNLNVSIAVPKALPLKTIHDIVAACQTLELFASEYYSSDLKLAIGSLLTLAKQLAQSYEWSMEDLPLLVYWINSTLEEYRTHVIQGTLIPGQFVSKFSVDSSSIQHILQVVCSKQLTRLREQLAHTKHQTDGTSKTSAITPELEKLIPMKDDKQLCLRFLSVKGCPQMLLLVSREELILNRIRYIRDLKQSSKRNLAPSNLNIIRSDGAQTTTGQCRWVDYVCPNLQMH